MAVTIQSKVDFCKYLLSHPAKDAVIEDITMKLMRSFQKGNPEIKEEAVRTLDSLEFFISQMQQIADANINLNEE